MCYRLDETYRFRKIETENYKKKLDLVLQRWQVSCCQSQRSTRWMAEGSLRATADRQHGHRQRRGPFISGKPIQGTVSRDCLFFELINYENRPRASRKGTLIFTSPVYKFTKKKKKIAFPKLRKHQQEHRLKELSTRKVIFPSCVVLIFVAYGIS